MAHIGDGDTQDNLAFILWLAEDGVDYIEAGDAKRAMDEWEMFAAHKDAEHMGDCTNVASTCMRCYYEDFFKRAGYLLTFNFDPARS